MKIITLPLPKKIQNPAMLRLICTMERHGYESLALALGEGTDKENCRNRIWVLSGKNIRTSTIRFQSFNDGIQRSMEIRKHRSNMDVLKYLQENNAVLTESLSLSSISADHKDAA